MWSSEQGVLKVISVMLLTQNPSILYLPPSILVLSSSHLWIEAPIMAASKRTVLQFSSSQTLSGKVHPLVIFNICDCYVRRPDQAERVIGTLLGSVLPDGTVDIRNSYAVPHNESVDQVFTLSTCIPFWDCICFVEFFNASL
jgi:hypothetical protein